MVIYEFSLNKKIELFFFGDKSAIAGGDLFIFFYTPLVL